MVTFSSLNTKDRAIEWLLEFPTAAWAAPCCEVDPANLPAADACRQPKKQIGLIGGMEIAPAGTPLLDGTGVAGDSTVLLKIDSFVMTDNLSVEVDNVMLQQTNNSTDGVEAIIPPHATTIIAYIQECYQQTGAWVTLPGKQGTDYTGAAIFKLFVLADETDIDLGD